MLMFVCNKIGPVVKFGFLSSAFWGISTTTIQQSEFGARAQLNLKRYLLKYKCLTVNLC